MITWLRTDFNYVIVIALVVAVAGVTWLAGVLWSDVLEHRDASRYDAELDAIDPTRQLPHVLAPLPPLPPLPAARHAGPDTYETSGLAAGPPGMPPCPARRAPAGEARLERRVSVREAEDMAAAWLQNDEYRIWDAAYRDAITAAWDWYYSSDRPWAGMTGQFAAVQA